MKTIEVGAFEAKTHLSRLLDEVEDGAVVRITRRGKVVAVLRADEAVSRRSGLAAIQSLRALCEAKGSLESVLAFRDEGRER